MIYAGFFLVLATACFYGFATGEGEMSGLLLWPALNMSWFAAVYTLNRPELLYGKGSTGKMNRLLVLFNLPWLVFSLMILYLQSFLSRENRMDAIPGTCWLLGSRPNSGYAALDVDLIVDLTAELPAPTGQACDYVCFPNLDGINLANLPADLGIGTSTRVFVHCAQGHGRSATWCALALHELGCFDSPMAAYAAIRTARRLARVSSAQKRQLQN